ncbi:MAG TPA: patatin-like phospholipase family protein [Gemmatimonadaceae bacterium]
MLSGGGAKGLVHVGVLRVLDSLGIRPDLVVGTSMGAVVGALYASGYSGAAIDSLARALPLERLFHAYQPVAPRSLDWMQPLVMWEQGERGFALQGVAVHDPEVNALISSLMLRGNLYARGRFDSLPIPFRAVATNLADRSLVVLDSGDLARAVRASFAIPLIFSPERIDGHVLGDGGLSANVPVSVARAAGAERVIVSDVTAGVADSVGLDAPLALASHLIAFLFHQPEDSLGPGDVRIRADMGPLADLDFSRRNVARMIGIGRAAAARALRPSECAAAPPRDPVLPTHLARFTVQGGREQDRLVLRSLLGFAHGDTIDPAALRRRILRLGESDRYTGVWLDPRGVGDSVSFDIAARDASRRVAGVGLAYDHELGGRAWLGYADRRLLGSDMEGSVVLRAGSLRQDLLASVRRNYLLGRRLFSPVVAVTVSKEDVRRFTPTGEALDPTVVREATAFAAFERAYFGGWNAAVGGEALVWRDTTRAHRRALGGALRVMRVSRTGDRSFETTAQWNSEFARVALEASPSAWVGAVQVSGRVRLGWGRDLPLPATFPLGGTDGFPGLHLGERRGDREAFAAVRVAYPVIGPLLARAELAAGNTATVGTALPMRGWLFGARAGVGVDTPVGPIRLEYGYNSLHRGAVFVRVGRWF